MFENIKKAFMSKKYNCSKCHNDFSVSLSNKFIKVSMPTCPVCGSKNVKLR